MLNTRSWHVLTSLVLLAFGSASGSAADIEAYAGRPFGVARVTIPFPAQDVGLPLGRSAFLVDESNGRVLYPSFSEGPFKRLFGGNAPPPATLMVFFLFRGEQPLEVSIRTPSRQSARVVPRAGPPRLRARLLRQWWRYYNIAARQQARDGDYPPIVETYLMSTLSRRLGLAPPLASRLLDGKEQIGMAKGTFQLLMGVEALRLEMLRRVCLSQNASSESARLPVPRDIQWQPVIPPKMPDNVPIEPMAMHVPEECYYLRFGSFSNYWWFNTLLRDYGGDIGAMVTARSWQLGLNDRVQQQLCLEQNALAELVGPKLIKDMAIIGRDTYMREGAAIGVLFQARGSLLGAELARQQDAAWNRERQHGATRKTVTIAGHPVSLVCTPDNRLRSYRVVDGDFHLVTTSKTIATRFLAAGRGESPLGASAPFRHARSLLPLKRDDTVFAYFSPAFFQGLLSPQYQLELTRRLRAVVDIELIKLARLAARAEGVARDSIAQLVQADLLPRGFGHRSDGSVPIVTDDRIVDSLRGAPGTFTPIPDVPLRAVTEQERAWYGRRATYYAQDWRQLDPLMVAVHRYALDRQGRERLTIDAHIIPLSDAKISAVASMLAPATRQAVVPPDDTIVLVEAAMRGGVIFPNVPPHIMFLAVKDQKPLTDPDPTNMLKAVQILRTTPGVLGAWPKPGFLDLLPVDLGRPPDADGFSRLLFGVWRWQGHGFSLLSFDRPLLDQASRQVQLAEAKEKAQIRIHVGDLSQAKFTRWLEAMSYERARQTSVGNARFLNLLAQQLAVPRPEALNVAQDLLQAKLICTLGGKYELVERNGLPLWQSRAWPASRRYQLPDGYHSPLLTWFRGLEAMTRKEPGRLIVRAHLDMQRKEKEPALNLPLFNLFGTGKKTAEKSEKK